MSFLPWQQTSRGAGEIVALNPQERPQVIKSTAKGIVVEIAEGLQEGVKVTKGQLLLQIQPFAGNMVQQLESQLAQLGQKKEAKQETAEAYNSQVVGYTEAKEFTVNTAIEMVSAAEAKLKSKKDLIPGYEAKVLQAKLNYERQNNLFQQGIKPQKEVEKLKKEWEVETSNLASLHGDVEALTKEVAAKRQQQDEKERIAQTKIDYARSMLQSAKSEIAQVEKEIVDLNMKLGEMGRLQIRAPRDGTVFRLNVNEQSNTVKEGDELMTIVPEVTQQAVELFVAGNDMPLVREGQYVQLQFEGWPAVQVAGWPSMAINTFSGIVSTVDATDNGKGEFRLLVTPDPEGKDAWPGEPFTRQGVRANGWVQLKQVTLGYEIWRQLNGFPVILSDEKSQSVKKSKSKPPKIPK